ncbi:hypothetical protein M422DRAFT_266966 [Sphaerobolus stellatus SS14]|uniref:Uncharacterized protein n=1 Tax=Sphaerobolus stellatus (strain SS14) TaxID=990650 RepID=A0A0C9TN70_SPHS4|nr:hypothetical protein M422DRAFT_266966 [Sphaerobolus stellatus SS14]
MDGDADVSWGMSAAWVDVGADRDIRRRWKDYDGDFSWECDEDSWRVSKMPHIAARSPKASTRIIDSALSTQQISQALLHLKLKFGLRHQHLILRHPGKFDFPQARGNRQDVQARLCQPYK